MKHRFPLIMAMLCAHALQSRAQYATLPDPMPGGPTSAGYYYENKGQIIDDNGVPQDNIRYYSEKGRARMFFAADKVHHTVRVPGDAAAHIPDTAARLDVRFECRQWREGIEPCGTLKVYEQSTDFLNYFLPHCGSGITGVKGYKTVAYENAFPHTDVRYTADAAGPVMYIVLHPGANPSDIRLVMAGHDSLLQYVGGSLRAALGNQSIVFPKGSVYQIDGSGNPYVVPTWYATWYKVDDSTVGLNTGPYNTSDELVIKLAAPTGITGTLPGVGWAQYYDDPAPSSGNG